MLTSETKRHIDAARQVLVGVVPNPTSQIDQITNALIYKFMDDMDQSAIRAEGEPSFFIGNLEKYAWTRLMDSRIGNQDRMNLYSEALLKFSESTQLPELFRNIFKQAFLPYRSPEVLGLFLKEIDYFDYSHSEELGNAYEYLLSVMSSQGDAGQFRTPRHIIDFIVAAVNPTKNDKILDPACGTAGFLISAYKHILSQHDGKNSDGTKNDEKALTPDERRNLVSNFEGYDIDPGMVRISQVNMYLHQFKNPKIFQYDSLSQDERWNDKFDVILANPPFMSPKGGVQTHNKFSVQSNRSEVLFVDYIMNHLRPKGRAGIIVPEGIIFQSGTAYKQLRKNLVENGLYAVVSLPSGVFQPYSGVKTSILLFDNELAKKVKHIMFVKINNDGFDLGAQRRLSIYNDLPLALDALIRYKKHADSNGSYSIGGWPESKYTIDTHPNCHFVSKKEILESDDHNLTWERYKLGEEKTNTQWPMVELREVCDFIGGYAFKSEEFKKEKETQNDLPVIKIGNIDKSGILNIAITQYYEYKDFLKKYLILKGDILIAMTGATVGKVAYSQSDNLLLNQRVGLLRTDEKKVLKVYLKNLLLSGMFYEYCQSQAGGGAQGNIPPSLIQKYKIPLPPLEIQKQIVAELDGYQKIIEGARQIIENYKPNINFNLDWPNIKIEQLAYINKETIDPSKKYGDNLFTYIDISSVGNGTGDISYDNKIKGIDAPSRARRVIENDDILISTVRPNLKAFAYITNPPPNSLASTGFAVLTPKKDVVYGKFLYYAAGTSRVVEQMVAKMERGAYPSINQNDVENITIPTPSLDQQKKIAARIDEEQKIIDANKKLIKIYELKIREKIVEIWGN